MASPIVAGVAALVRSAHPDWTAQQVITRLEETAQDVYTPGEDALTGAGIVDAGAALGLPATKTAETSLGLHLAADGLRWRSPRQKTTGYTLEVINVETGDVRFSTHLPAGAVFVGVENLGAQDGDMAKLTAHLEDGRQVSEILFCFNNDKTQAQAVTGLTLGTGEAGLLLAKWHNPPGTVSIVLGLIVDGQVTHTYQASAEDGKPLPEHYLLPAHRARTSDYQLQVISYGASGWAGQASTEWLADRAVGWKTTWYGKVAYVSGKLAPSWLAAHGNPWKVRVRITHADGTQLERSLNIPVSLDRAAYVRLAAQEGDLVQVLGTSSKDTLTVSKANSTRRD